MKILHVLNTNRFSGAENVACQIIGILDSTEGIQSVTAARRDLSGRRLPKRTLCLLPWPL